MSAEHLAESRPMAQSRDRGREATRLGSAPHRPSVIFIFNDTRFQSAETLKSRRGKYSFQQSFLFVKPIAERIRDHSISRCPGELARKQERLIRFVLDKNEELRWR